MSAFLLFVLLAVSASAQQTITVGLTISKTGALTVDSMEQYRGFELWRDHVNAAGGINAAGKTYKVQLVSYDDESNSKRVQQLYSRLILQNKADFFSARTPLDSPPPPQWLLSNSAKSCSRPELRKRKPTGWAISTFSRCLHLRRNI